MSAGGQHLQVTIAALLSSAFVSLLVITVPKEAPEHSCAYFVANDRNKWLQFDVAGLQGATRQTCHSWSFQTPAKL